MPILTEFPLFLFKSVFFFGFFFLVSKNMRIFATDQASFVDESLEWLRLLERGLVTIDIDGILRPTMLFVGQVKGKDVFGRYCLCVQTSQL